MNGDKQKELQQILVQIEGHRKQAETINKQITLIDTAIRDLKSTNIALESLKKNKVGASLLVNIGSNSFVSATLSDNQKVLVSVGGNISVEKTIPEAGDILSSRETEFTKTLEKLQKSAIEINTTIEGLNQTAEGYVTQMQK